MSVLIVVTELQQLPATECWPRLVKPLAEELANSGLGDLPDLDSIRNEFDESGSLNLNELVVRLFNFDYGRQLVDQVVNSAGVNRGKPVVPERWHRFNCTDYFNSPLAEQGYWDELGQFWYIWPFERVYEDTERLFLVIGSPGVDGIDWGYRFDHLGLWKWSPIDAEFVVIAPSVDMLLKGWLSGAITL
ncbi:MAG: hypothetical protein JNJ77_12905 [Planctomycetia bacterium]|nr:hypothetical protein [Planctomycetia bacterium]